MKKQKIKPVPLLHGVPVVLLCAGSEEKIDITTIGDVAVMGLNPPLLGFSTHENHMITELIDKSRELSINIPLASMVDRVDYCGIHSGRDRDKTGLFTLENPTGIPIISECPVSLEVKVLEMLQIRQRVIWIGEVSATWAAEELIKGESLQMTGLKALHYGLDNRYYETGDPVGTGYSEGKSLD